MEDMKRYLAESEAKLLVDLLKAYADKVGENSTYDDTVLSNRILTTEQAIEALKGQFDSFNEEVEKKIEDAIDDFATKVSDDSVVNSFKELVDWVAEHGSEYGDLLDLVQSNTNQINDLSTSVSNNETAITAANARMEAQQGLINDLAININSKQTLIDNLQKLIDDNTTNIQNAYVEIGEIKSKLEGLTPGEGGDALSQVVKEYVDGQDSMYYDKIGSIEEQSITNLF